jgi:putative DNA primase/helicase
MTAHDDDEAPFDAGKAIDKLVPFRRTNVEPEPDLDAYIAGGLDRDGAMRKAKPKPRVIDFPADELDSAKAKPKAGEEPKAKSKAETLRPEEELRLATDVPYEMGRMFLLYRYSHGGLVTLIYWRGDLLRWTGTHYAEMNPEVLKSQLWDFLSKINSGQFKPHDSDINGVVAAIKGRVIIDDEKDVGAWLGEGAAPWGEEEVIVCRNGVVRLADGELWAHSPQLLVLNAIDTDYEPAAVALRWEQFLAEIWPDEVACRAMLQEWFGLLLTDETKYQKGLMLYGPARSGKGTIGRMIRNLLGARNFCAPNLTQLGKDFGLEPLIGKKVAVIGDARTDHRSNHSVITERLLSTIGEDPQDINRKNRKFWSGILRTRVQINSNELPDLKDDTGVVATRFIILQIRVSYLGREDFNLEKKLVPELSGILNWAIAGYQRLREADGFTIVGDSSLNDELAAIGSTVHAFVEDRGEVDKSRDINCTKLFKAYDEWCKANGIPVNRRLDNKHFGIQLRSAYPGCIYRNRLSAKADPDRPWHYFGIGLRSTAPRPKPR